MGEGLDGFVGIEDLVEETEFAEVAGGESRQGLVGNPEFELVAFGILEIVAFDRAWGWDGG